MGNVTRRNFILSSAAATCLLTTGEVSAERKAHMREYGDFRVGIQSNVLNVFSPELEPMLGHIADLGLGYVEFAHWHYEVTQDETRIAEVQALLRRHNIMMEAYFLGEIEADEQKLRETFEFAKKNGASVLVGQPVPEAFPILDALVREFDIKVAIHNYGPGHRFDLIENMLVAAAPWDWRIGYCFDTGHAMRSGENPIDAVRRMGSRLYGMHLREHAAISREPQPPETIIGEGALDLQALIGAMQDVGFSGPLSLEMYYNPQDPLESLRTSLDNLTNAIQAGAKQA